VALFGALMANDIVEGIRIALMMSALFLLVTAIVSLAGVRVPHTQDAETGSARARRPVPTEFDPLTYYREWLHASRSNLDRYKTDTNPSNRTSPPSWLEGE